MKRITNFLVVLGFCFFCGCDKTDPKPVIDFTADFEAGKGGWIAGFSDYSSLTNPQSYEYDSALSNLPAPLNTSKKGFRIGGNNTSDDLFMFLKKKVQGLNPGQGYKIKFQISLASNAPSNWVGAGGPPGEGVKVKIGATAFEPIVTLVNNEFRINVDKGGNGNDGTQMKIIGNVATGLNTIEYKLIVREGEFFANSDAMGNLWLIVGTDSGFEGKTVLYYDNISISII